MNNYTSLHPAKAIETFIVKILATLIGIAIIAIISLPIIVIDFWNETWWKKL